MKLPSFRQAYQEALTTARRFPVVLVDATLGTIAALILIDHEGPAQPTILFNILLAGILGSSLLTALALTAERRGLKRPARLGLQAIGIILLAGYGLTVPTDLTHAPQVTLFRFFILAAALHMLVSAAPHAGKGDTNGFWQYNRALFLRILTAILYSLVLYAGLAIALAALDNLFGVSVPGKRYLELWILITGVFTTWYFLAGIPENLAALDAMADYPKSLKVLAQYILLPIVVIYLIILYAYLAKIVVAWDWPQGWVSKLILGFSGTGIFSLLLLHPIMGRTDNVWLKRTERWFYLILIPLVVMLFLAVGRRVSEYGITEGRYLAIILGIWLGFLILYFTISAKRNIKMIPASLCVLAFAISFGPWGIFSTARQSQIGRLERLTSEAGILVNSRVQPVHAEIPFARAKEISAVLAYLHEVHGFGEIQPWFDKSLREDTSSSLIAYKNPEAVAKMMGFQFVSRWAESPYGIVTFDAAGAFDPRGYERMAILQMYWSVGNKVEFPSDGILYKVSAGMDTMTFSSVGTGAKLVEIDLRRHAEGLLTKYRSSATDRIPTEEMALSADGNGLRVRLCPSRLQVQERDGKTKLAGISAVVLFTVEK
jgi:hypothetical protein